MLGSLLSKQHYASHCKKSVDVCRRYIVRHQHRFSGHTVYTVLNVVMGVMGYV